jgi:hypothetical protein
MKGNFAPSIKLHGSLAQGTQEDKDSFRRGSCGACYPSYPVRDFSGVNVKQMTWPVRSAAPPALNVYCKRRDDVSACGRGSHFRGGGTASPLRYVEDDVTVLICSVHCISAGWEEGFGPADRMIGEQIVYS